MPKPPCFQIAFTAYQEMHPSVRLGQQTLSHISCDWYHEPCILNKPSVSVHSLRLQGSLWPFRQSWWPQGRLQPDRWHHACSGPKPHQQGSEQDPWQPQCWGYDLISKFQYLYYKSISMLETIAILSLRHYFADVRAQVSHTAYLILCFWAHFMIVYRHTLSVEWQEALMFKKMLRV